MIKKIFLIVCIAAFTVLPTLGRWMSAPIDKGSLTITVAGAGTESANGDYREIGVLNNRPFYLGQNGYIWWVGTHWTIYTADLDDGAYRTFEDVPQPAMAKEWIVDVGVAPVPTVCEQ